MQAIQIAAPRSAEVEKNNQSEQAWVVALVVVCVALLVNLVVLFWGLNRGLDVDVESFYLVQYQHPSIYPAFSSFHLLLSKIPKLVSSEILHYRFLEIAARLIPILVLSLGFARWSNPWLHLSKVKTALLATFGVLGATIVFCCFPRTISYNGLSSALITLSVACAFFAASDLGAGRMQRFGKPLLLALAGFCIALNLFVKFTSALVLLPVLLGFLLVQRRSLRECGAVIAGGVAGLIFFFGFVQGMGDWWTAFSEATKFELLTDHSPHGMAAGALLFVRKHWWHGVALVAAAIGLNRAISSQGPERQRNLVHWLCGAYTSALVLLTVALLVKPGLLASRDSLVTIVTVAFFLMLLSVNRTVNWRFEIGALVLLVLPLIAAVGTNCSFLPHVASNLGPWLIFIMVAAIICADRYKTPYAMAGVCGALAVLTMTQFFEQYVYYRDDNLWLTEQTETTSKIPLLSGLKLHHDDIQFYENAQKILVENGFRKGDNILSLYDFPVIVYLMQAVSPGHSWYISWPERDEINAHYFREAKLTKDQRLFLVLGGANPKKIVDPEMQEALLDPKLGKTFKRIGVLPHPRKDDFKVYFYASR